MGKCIDVPKFGLRRFFLCFFLCFFFYNYFSCDSCVRDVMRRGFLVAEMLASNSSRFIDL